ncbi:MAG: hypothetical protein ACR2PX_16215 [Endozoicomonas sp.]|uniref:hypothetical protein n=1 Tax=Endozoicomonas sp. TaxID=1892382 RepID=UPI003D9AD610
MTNRRYTQNDINNQKGKTDWNKLEQKTDSEIAKAALNDQDAPLTSDYDANKFKSRKAMRHKLGL